MKAIFHIPPNEYTFVETLLSILSRKYPDVDILLAVGSPQEADAIKALSPNIADTGRFIPSSRIYFLFPFPAQVYVTPEQYGVTPRYYPSICCFHGQPSKGLTLAKGLVCNFDYFFSYGPFHTNVLKKFLDKNLGGIPPHLEIRDVGYPKSDRLIQGYWNREEVLRGIGLDPERKTLIYAPAFNEGASLREFGPQLVGILSSMESCNVIIKLSVDNFSAASNEYANGGVNWFEALASFEALPNVYLSRERLVDPYLAAADVLITDVSSVSFEFMVLGKPVVFIDTPCFFSRTLKKYFPHEDTEKWRDRPDVNAGREFGIVAQNLEELPEAIRTALAKGYNKDFRDRMRERLLYNPGCAAEAAADAIHDILLQESRRGILARAVRYLHNIVRPAALKVLLKQLAPGLFLRLRALKDIISKRVDYDFINRSEAVHDRKNI